MSRIARHLVILGCAVLAGCGRPAGQGEGGSGEQGAAPQVAAAPAAFAVCSSCHAVAPGQNGTGPTLAGVWGRKAGTLPGYAYSEPLKRSGIVWNARTLDTWLRGPMQMVPGTRMVIGIPNPEARQAVIAYLEKLK